MKMTKFKAVQIFFAFNRNITSLLLIQNENSFSLHPDNFSEILKVCSIGNLIQYFLISLDDNSNRTAS